MRDKQRRPKQDENEPDDWSLPFIIGTGTFDSFTAVPENDKKITKRQIGFIQQKPKRKVKKDGTKSKRSSRRS